MAVNFFKGLSRTCGTPGWLSQQAEDAVASYLEWAVLTILRLDVKRQICFKVERQPMQHRILYIHGETAVKQNRLNICAQYSLHKQQ